MVRRAPRRTSSRISQERPVATGPGEAIGAARNIAAGITEGSGAVPAGLTEASGAGPAGPGALPAAPTAGLRTRPGWRTHCAAEPADQCGDGFCARGAVLVHTSERSPE